MLQSDEQWLAIADEFYAAAVDHSLWYSALAKLAFATGSKSGELISIGANADVPVNLMTNVDPALQDAFVACRGGDPAVNPRVAAGMRSPVLKIMAENDFITPEAHAIHPHYQGFARPWDIPYICLSTLERRDDLLIGLAVLRSQAQGHIDSQERDVFASLAPHVRAAVRMQMSLEGSANALITGTLEALSMSAFVCGSDGTVLALTAQAETLVQGQRGLALRNQKLRATHDADDRVLTTAIEKSAAGLQHPGAPLTQAVVVRGTDEGAAPIVLDVMPLPRKTLEITGRQRVVIVARGARGGESRKATILQRVYGLTAAETDIALQLSQAKTTETIAQERQVAVGTVRVQIKNLLAKLGVKRQVELVARLSEL